MWNPVLWEMLDFHTGSYSMSVLVRDVRRDVEWVATSVYGPNISYDRSALWAELSSVAGIWHLP